MNAYLYEAVATAAEAGREGSVRTSDGCLAADLSIPEELGGAGGPGTNPEQLFAAGYFACLTSALKLVGRRRRKDISGCRSPRECAFTAARTAATCSLPNSTCAFQRWEATPLVPWSRKAHEICPYSNATRGNLDIGLNVLESPTSEAPA